MKQITILILFLIVFVSCGKKQTHNVVKFKGHTVDIEIYTGISEPTKDYSNLEEIDLTNVLKDNNFDFSTILANYELVFLETTDDCVIGEIRKIIHADDFILILDPFVAKKLFMFDCSGKFIRQIGKQGEGPGEYIHPTDVYYDETKKHIVMYDQFRSKFFFYDTNGNFIEERKNDFWILQFTQIKDEYVYRNFGKNKHIPTIQESSLIIASDSGSIKFACLPLLKMNYGEGALQKLNDTVIAYAIPFCDTIYHYCSGVLSPRYVLKMPGKLPDNFAEKSNYDYEKFRKKYSSDQYCWFDGNFTETDEYLQFYVFYKDYTYTIIYNKVNKSIICGVKRLRGGTDAGNKFENILMFSKPICCNRDYFISIMGADDLCRYYPSITNSEEEKTKLLYRYPQLSHINPEDNPVLVYCRLK
jgi:hypothetical protein